MQRLCILLTLLVVTDVSAFAPSRLSSISLKRAASLQSRLAVGDTVIAEVDDIRGSVSDPMVSFLIKNEGKTTKASMSTKSLSSTERLALQAGSVMQVYVSKMDGSDDVQVSLKPIDGSKPIVMKETRETIKSNQISFKPAEGRLQTLPSKPKFLVSGAAKLPSGGLLLNNLKTGMELEGSVHSCTNYAAFISANIYRAGKAGTFQTINGMLHKVDILDKSLLSTGNRKSMNAKGSRGYEEKEEGIIAKGTKVKVYVKEVFKQSGRLTLTTDATIDKSRILGQKEELRTAGNDRRRARRMRLQLEKVVVGDTVVGVVQQVVSAGILVSVNSLGPLNVTALIAKKDLPKQFEVPADLKESFQKQLLEQDFVVGREITCGVLQINPNIGTKVTYNLKMLFEELGPLAADKVPISDSGDRDTDSEDDDEEAVPQEAEVFDDSDLKEIFDELRGSKALLSVADLKAWGDVQDMMEGGIIDNNQLDGAIEEASGKAKGKVKEITFEQFVEVVDMLQDAMEGMTTDLDDFEDDDEEESVSPVIKVPTKITVPDVKKVEAIPITKKSDPIVAKAVVEEEEEEENDSEDSDEDDDETMKDVARELFDELKGGDSKLSVAAFKSWSDVKDLVDNDLITSEALNEMILKVSNGKKNLDFEQFFSLVSSLDESGEDDFDEETLEKVELNGEEEEMNDKEMREIAQEEFDSLRGKEKKVSVIALKAWSNVIEMLEDQVITKDQLDEIVGDVADGKKQLDFEQFYEIVIALENAAVEGNEYLEKIEDDEEKADATDVEDDDEDLLEISKTLFDELRGKDKKVSVTAFMGWSEIKEMMEDGVMTQEQLTEIVAEIADGKKQLDFETFHAIVKQLDNMADDMEEDDEEEEDMEEIARELFEELKGKNKRMSIKSLKEWEDVKDLLSDDLITEEVLDEIITRVAAGKKDLDFDQFFKIVSELDELAEEANDDEFDGEEEEDEETDIEDEDDEDDVSDEEMKETALELYNELKGKDKKLSVAAFKAWDDLKEMLAGGVVTQAEINGLINDVSKGGKQLDFEQFYEIVQAVDDLAEGGAEEDDEEVEEEDEVDPEDKNLEEIAKEYFNELRGKDKTVSASAIKAWDYVTDLIEDGVISKEDLNDVVKESAGGKKVLNFEQFFEVVETLDDLTAAADDEDDEEEMEELSDKELRAIAQEEFDGLRGKEKKVSVTALKAWSNVVEMLEDKVIKQEQLDEIVADIADGKKQVDFEQFYAIVTALEGAAEEGNMYLEKKDDADEGDELSEEDLKEVAKELFNELKGKDTKLTIAAFKAWSDIKEMVEDGVMTKKELDEMVSEVANGKKNLDFEQFFDLVGQLDELAEGEDDEDFDDEEDDDEDEDEVEQSIVQTSKGFGKAAVPVKAQTIIEEDDEEDVDFEDLNDEEVDEMLREVFDELKGKNKVLSMKEFKAWEDIEEMLESGMIAKEDIDTLAKKVGVEKSFNFDQFKAVVELLDEVAGESDGDEMSDRDGEREGDEEERIEVDGDEIGGDGEEMTAEEIEEMTKDLFDTLRGTKKTVSVATFLAWDDVQDMVKEGVLDNDTIDILLEEVGVNKNRKGDLTYQQFGDLVRLLDENMEALGDGEGMEDDVIMDADEDEEIADNVSATLEEREEVKSFGYKLK